MLILDLYKVIDDDTKFDITYSDGILYENVRGDDWSQIPEHVLEWRVRDMFIGFTGALHINAK